MSEDFKSLTKINVKKTISSTCFQSYSYLKMLSFDRNISFVGKFHRNDASFSTSPFCCNASHKHWIWSGLNDKYFLPNSMPAPDTKFAVAFVFDADKPMTLLLWPIPSPESITWFSVKQNLSKCQQFLIALQLFI